MARCHERAFELRQRNNEPWVSITRHPVASGPTANIVKNLDSRAQCFSEPDRSEVSRVRPLIIRPAALGGLAVLAFLAVGTFGQAFVADASIPATNAFAVRHRDAFTNLKFPEFLDC